jgi:hypothetical protein
MSKNRDFPAGSGPQQDVKNLIANCRSALEAASEVIGLCDCIMSENPEKDPRHRWYTARAVAVADCHAMLRSGGPTPEGERLRALIADDSYAIQFQTMGQYRSALLRGAATQPAGDPE